MSQPTKSTTEPLFRGRTLAGILCLAALLAPAGASFAIRPEADTLAQGGRNFDARVDANARLRFAPAPDQLRAESDLRRSIRNLSVRYEPTTGAAKTISNNLGYLSEANLSQGPSLAVGMEFVHQNLTLLGLTTEDLADYEITDTVPSRVSGATHIYLRQTHEGLPVYNGQLQLHINREGRVISVNNAFLPNLAQAVNTTSPAITASQAALSVADHLGLEADVSTLSSSPIEARLMWLPIRGGEARLVWNFQVQTLDGNHWYDLTVDAVDGKVWTRFDWVSDAQYKVYEQPVLDPDHTTPAPPADARTTAVDPQDVTASPFGWHDTDGTAGAEFTIHRGNNTHAWEDSDANNSEPTGAEVEPDCGAALDCSFDPLDLTMDPATYEGPSTTNLFYWVNIIHDVQYLYGFDEMGGNFQANNYGNGGVGGDYIRALAQSGSGNCNANFSTPTDGGRGRMRMYNCANTTPRRNGDIDSIIIAHEFGHGISIRQVGGPANSSCLNNTQQPGEGWSDWLGLVYTATAADVATDGRGIATWLFGQASDGPGIRGQKYSTDPLVNTWTYESISGVGVPHGVGSVWSQAIWEVYWALVGAHGFGTDLHDAGGGFGNQRAMLYINEGLKNTACGPSFLDTRDGIIQAAVDNNGGEDVCRIWTAFAGFGLGEDATTAGANTQSATNGFAIPSACLLDPIFLDGFESGDTSAWSATAP